MFWISTLLLLTIVGVAASVEDLKMQISDKIIFLEDSTYKCFDCDYVSPFRGNVAKHIEARHLGLRGIVCPICLKPTTTREALKKHISRTHKNLWFKSFIVYLFVILVMADDMEDLKMKINEKILVLEDRFKCTDCDYESKFRHNLPKHIESRHVSLAGLACHICMKTLPTRESYRRHIIRHSSKNCTLPSWISTAISIPFPNQI